MFVCGGTNSVQRPHFNGEHHAHPGHVAPTPPGGVRYRAWNSTLRATPPLSLALVEEEAKARVVGVQDPPYANTNKPV